MPAHLRNFRPLDGVIDKPAIANPLLARYGR
jgi:hypothetical protein